MKHCPKCNEDYNEEFPYCPNFKCRTADVKGLALPEEGGRLMYIWGYRYPMLGFPTGEVLFATNGMKRATLELLRFEAKRPFFLFDILFFRKKLLRDTLYFLDRYYESGYRTHIQPVIDRNLLCRSAREIRRVLVWRYGELGAIDALIGCYENDFAYRYRIQDIFGAFNLEELKKNPRKEILHVFDIWQSREKDENVLGKSRLLRKFLSPLLFFSPRLRREIVEFIMGLDMDQITLTLNDLYWTGKIFDIHYNFNDKTWQEQMAFSNALEIGWTEEEKPLKKDEQTNKQSEKK